MRPVVSSLNATSGAFHHSAWRSPVPYLFGGLCLMFMVIAVALLLLACSYWNISNMLESREDRRQSNPEDGDQKTAESIKTPGPLDVKVVVIMAGDENPTYLAYPMSIVGSSPGDEKESKVKKTHMPEGENRETQNQSR